MADGAGVVHVEGPGEGGDARQEQDAGGPHGDLVDPQHEAEAVDAHGQHQHREQPVGQAQGQVGFGQADQALGAAHQGVTRAPHRQREERDGGQQRQERADDPPVHAEVRTGRHRIVGAVDGPEQAHGRQDQRADQGAQQHGHQAGLERQPEQHRKAAQHRGGKGIGAAEDQAEQVEGLGIPFVVRDLFDPEGFYLADAGRAVVIVHDLLRSLRAPIYAGVAAVKGRAVSRVQRTSVRGRPASGLLVVGETQWSRAPG